MAKRKRKSTRRASAGVSVKGDYKSKLIKVGCLAAGIALGKLAKDKLATTTASVTGIDGVTSAQMVSGAIAAAGVVGSVMLKNPYLKDVALGMGVAGTAAVVNSLTGNNTIALGDTEAPLMLPTSQEWGEQPQQVESVISGFGSPAAEEGVDPVFAGVGDTSDMILS